MTGRQVERSPEWVLSDVCFVLIQKGEFVWKREDLIRQEFDDWVTLVQGKTRLPVSGRVKLQIKHVAPKTKDDASLAPKIKLFAHADGEPSFFRTSQKSARTRMLIVTGTQ
jgi:hypothetical protein